MDKKIVFGLDFDGTLVTHMYPQIGEDIGAFPVLNKIHSAGHKFVLNTMRDKNFLDEAVEYIKQRGIPLYGINRNPDQSWTNSPKVYAHIYIDDAALGTPLIYPKIGRPYVNWIVIEQMLISMKII